MADYQPGTPVPVNGQQQQQRATITTSLMSMWDANNNGVQLRVSALDNGLSISFWIPFIGPDGRRSYPREQRINTILTQKNCVAMEKLIVEILLPAYAAGKDCRVSVFTNNARSTVFELEVRGGEFFANLHQGCDATTHVPQSSLSFKFESVLANESFDQATGEFKVVPIQADFYLFSKVLQGYNYLSSGTISGHGVRYSDHSYHAQLMDTLKSIANAVHAQLPVPTYNRTGLASGFNNGMPAGMTTPPANGAATPPSPVLEEVELSELY